jgi:hypothetical protein
MIMAKSSKSDQVLIPFHESIIPDTPFFDTASISRRDVTYYYHCFVICLSLLELGFQPRELGGGVISLVEETKVEVVTTLSV